MRYNNYCGNENVAFIYYNEWSDPKIEYKGFQWSSWMIEDALRNDFEESNLPNTESHFVAFVASHVEDYLNDCLFGLGYFDVDFIHENAPSWFEELRNNIDNDCWYTVSDEEVLEHYKGIEFVVEDFVSL